MCFLKAEDFFETEEKLQLYGTERFLFFKLELVLFREQWELINNLKHINFVIHTFGCKSTAKHAYRFPAE